MVSDDVREVKSRLDIAEVIGDYVALRRNGQTYWGRCPFHNEKTPSFSVSPERQTFHCFGCGKGGDIFTFIMEIENLEFREALDRLAERAGVKLHQYTDSTPKKNKMYGSIQIHALDFFRKSLEDTGGETARAYLNRRSMTLDNSRRFEIGWAPPSWDGLIKYLGSLGFNENQILDSGLAASGNSGIYDRFRGRIMFPIYSTTDRLVGFGGRILDGDGAKYLNSPESSLFNKRNNLYLLNKAKMSIRQKNCAILVEGYMDAIRAHLSGFTNTIASLGTALTESQALLIKRMTGLCYICYDSDNAGQEAALKGMYVLQKQGVSVKVVRLTGGKDPDEVLLQDEGVHILESAIESALPLPLFHAVLRSKDMEIPEKSLAARNELLEGLASLSQFDVIPYLDKLGQQLGVFPHELRQEISARQEKIRGRESKRMPEDDSFPYNPNVTEDSEEPADDLECVFCSLLWGSEDLRSNFMPESVVPFITGPVLQNIVTALLTGEQPGQIEARWRQMKDMKGFNLIAKGNGILAREGLDAEKAEEIADTLRKRSKENRALILQAKLKKGTATESDMQEHLELFRILKGGNFGA